MQKICLGGSFNPVHHGHLLCARAAAEKLQAGSVVLIPTGLPPHKLQENDLAPAADRLEMCRRAVAGTGGFEVDDREIRRAGPSFTIQTARELKQSGWDQVTWLIGADLLAGLPSWHEADALIREVHLIPMARPGWTFDWSILPRPFQILKQRLVEVPQIDISATDIRRRVRDGRSIDFLTPPAVGQYIQQRSLYR